MANRPKYFTTTSYDRINVVYRLNMPFEPYSPVITMPYEDWIRYVTNGKNTLYGDAIIPSGTVDNGAVYMGHVRQNPWTAGDEESSL